MEWRLGFCPTGAIKLAMQPSDLASRDRTDSLHSVFKIINH